MFAVRSEPALASDQMLTASQKFGVLLQKDFVELEGRRVAEVIMGIESLKHVEPNDFIISMRSFQGGLEWSKLRGSTSFHYVMVRPVMDVHPPFFAHLFKSATYIHALRSTTDLIRDGQELRYSNFVQVDLPVVPMDEQIAIASFLDRETAKIDALVEEQKRLIELLKEKRQAVISQAVTKGLDSTVPMKESGVEWLGQVPAHWLVCALRRVVAAIEQGWSPECEASPADDQSWGVLKAGCVNRGVFDPSENKALPLALAPAPEYEVRHGDVLVSRASGSPELVGSAALVGETRSKLMLSDKIFRVHLTPQMASAFFVWAMNGKALRGQIERALSGGNGMANNLPQSALLAFLVAVPPMGEQLVIASAIEDSVRKCDALIAQADCAIDLLLERRSALVSAAVTGKIDVRGLAAQPEAVAA
jgi:type I restriction enzyme S subunit